MANNTFVDPATTDKRPETPSTLPSVSGSTGVLLGEDIRGQEEKLQAERLKNGARNRIGGIGEDLDASIERSDSKQLKNADTLLNYQVDHEFRDYKDDFLPSLYGLDAGTRNNSSPRISTAQELSAGVAEVATERVGKVTSISIDILRRGGGKVFELFVAEAKDVGSQLKTGEVTAPAHQEAVAHDTHAIPAERTAETHAPQVQTLKDIAKGFGVEIEDQIGIPDLGLKAEQIDAPHNEAGNPEKLAKVRGFLTEKSKHLETKVSQIGEARIAEEIQIARAEAGITDNAQENALLGHKSLDYGADKKRNRKTAHDIHMAFVEQKAAQQRGHSDTNMGGTFRSIRRDDEAAGQEIREAMTKGDEKGVKSQRVG